MEDAFKLGEALFGQYPAGLVWRNVENFQEIQKCGVGKKRLPTHVALNNWKRTRFDKFCQVFRSVARGFGHREKYCNPRKAKTV
jgi:hypothetical protein